MHGNSGPRSFYKESRRYQYDHERELSRLWVSIEKRNHADIAMFTIERTLSRSMPSTVIDLRLRLCRCRSTGHRSASGPETRTSVRAVHIACRWYTPPSWKGTDILSRILTRDKYVDGDECQAQHDVHMYWPRPCLKSLLDRSVRGDVPTYIGTPGNNSSKRALGVVFRHRNK